VHRLLHRKLIPSASYVLYERMPGDHDSGAAVLLEPAHRTKPCLQPAMVGLDPVVGVPIGAVPRRRQQLLQDDRIGRCLVGHHLDGRHVRGPDGALKETSSGRRVAPWGDEHIDELPELVDRAVDVAPPAGDLHVGLVDPPTAPDRVAAGAGGLGQQRREPQHPSVDGDVVDLDPAFG
jgi:hypothetical protein